MARSYRYTGVSWRTCSPPLPSVNGTSNTEVTQCGKHFPSYLFHGSSPVGKISVALCCMVNLRKIKISLWDVRALTALLMGCWSA